MGWLALMEHKTYVMWDGFAPALHTLTVQCWMACLCIAYPYVLSVVVQIQDGRASV